MVDHVDEPLLDLGARVHRARGRGFEFHLPLAERIRIARGFRQAVVKVVSYARSVKRVQQLMGYISRKGTLELETETGERIKGTDQEEALVQNWSADFDPRRNSRDTVHIVFSMPPGSDPDALRKAVRSVGARAFPDHEWIFGIHEDKKHPHAHMVVKMRGRQKEKKLRLNKPELYQLRELFAGAARAQGVALAASPRAARGVGHKGVRQSLYYLQQRGVNPEVKREAVREALHEFKQGKTGNKDWENAMVERHQKEKEIYRTYAKHLRKRAAEVSEEKRQKLLKAAEDLEKFSAAMPKPKTRRQFLFEKIAKANRKQSEKTRSQGQGQGMGL